MGRDAPQRLEGGVNAVGGVQPLLATGEVRHTRLRPARHAFAYRNWFMLLPMRALRGEACAALPRNRAGLVSFHDSDHGDGGTDALAWAERLLAAEGIHDADGEIWLQTYPRVLGYAFKPVSFWYCHRSDGSLAAVLAEVNNTFGERHVYLLNGPTLAFGREQAAHKVFHVSPFCRVEGRYRFRFMRTADRIVARVDHDDDAGALLQTSVSGRLEPLTSAATRRALLGMPLMTLGVIARIHWQALKLWRKRVPFFRKPEPPQAFVSR
ncbi:MAG: DUF1365 domain-containing protein [Burkholderiaceae bacterium]|nr:DUF1365 domain-containing protein [Rhodoferax sp.]MCP5286682.1 DUF1365 domain-containing protein [Burkholderiaceae bacterium]